MKRLIRIIDLTGTGLMLKNILVLTLLYLPITLAAETGTEMSEVLNEELKNNYIELLKGNIEECDFTGRVKIKTVSVRKEIHDYVVLAFNVEVLERFKGERVSEISYFQMIEKPTDPSAVNRLAGTTAIVSLFRDDQSGWGEQPGWYNMGSNGYRLPDTDYLLSIARGLAKNVERTDKRNHKNAH